MAVSFHVGLSELVPDLWDKLNDPGGGKGGRGAGKSLGLLVVGRLFVCHQHNTSLSIRLVGLSFSTLQGICFHFVLFLYHLLWLSINLLELVVYSTMLGLFTANLMALEDFSSTMIAKAEKHFVLISIDLPETHI